MVHRERPVPTPLVLLGRWHLARVIEDRLAGERLVVDGHALLERYDGRVRWHEEGTLRRPGADDLPVSRTLWLEPPAGGEEPSRWWVTFEDGGRFHPWAPGTDVEHACGEDLYRGLVEVVDPDLGWSVVWQVRGPRKDYVMTTAYRRRD